MILHSITSSLPNLTHNLRIARPNVIIDRDDQLHLLLRFFIPLHPRFSKVILELLDPPLQLPNPRQIVDILLQRENKLNQRLPVLQHRPHLLNPETQPVERLHDAVGQTIGEGEVGLAG